MYTYKDGEIHTYRSRLFWGFITGFLATLAVSAVLLAWWCSRPVCDDLQRFADGQLVCIAYLGEIEETEANVIMRD